MKTITKAEFKRMTQNKVLYFIVILLIIWGILSCFLYEEKWNPYDILNRQKITIANVLMFQFYYIFSLFFFLKANVLNDYICIGYSRIHIYFSKQIVYSIESFIISFFCFLTLNCFFIKDNFEFDTLLIIIRILVSLIILSLVISSITFAIGINSTYGLFICIVIAIIYAMCNFVLMELIKFSSLPAILRYSFIFANNYLFAETIDTKTYLFAIVCQVIQLSLVSFIGLKVFQKKDF